MKTKFLMAFLLLPALAAAQTYSYSVLYSFKNNGTDPQNPYAPLIVDSSGNLYGTSNNGGKNALGSVFKVSKSGAFTLLYSFKGGTTDGENPQMSVVRDSSGNLYGTTEYGGEHGGGIVFKLSSSGQETVLFSDFNATGTNGGVLDSVIRDSAGNLYGTTLQGGSGYGVAFKLDTSGNYTVLHDFCTAHTPDCPDGAQPLSLITAGGDYYSATESGGSLGGGTGGGTLFKMTPEGVVTVLHTFGGAGDGTLPGGSLRQDAKGNLYGVALEGGSNGRGILYKQPEAGGEETILYNFGSLANCADGCEPIGPIAMDKSGHIFGIAFTGSGFIPANPVVWEVSAAGKESIVHTFGKNVFILTGIIIDSAGNLYGVSASGGPANLGGVFKLTLQ